MKISVVTTMYHSSPFINEFYRRISDEILKITEDYEIIFINDGSPDDALNVAVSLNQKDNKVKVIDLSRNFGHHKAMMTGLSHTKGEYVFLIDCDLEEEPELLGLFWEKFHACKSIDVVYGVQKKRKGHLFEKISGYLFYKLFNFLSDIKIPSNLITVRLMSKRYVLNLIKHEESEIVIAGLWENTGFNQVPLPVNKNSKDTTTYSLSKKFALLVNSVTSFSNKPLRYIFYLGLIFMLVAFVYIVNIIYNKLFLSLPVPGYTSIIASIWFLGGVSLCCIGVVGIYLSKIFMEVKNRPYTIVRTTYGDIKKI